MNWIERKTRNLLQHYNHEKYWKMRGVVVNPDIKCSAIKRAWYLFRIKRMDAFNHASMGTHYKYGTWFEEPPKLPHGLYGIIVSHNTKIGRNCTIFHQVTIGESGIGGVPRSLGEIA